MEIRKLLLCLPAIVVAAGCQSGDSSPTAGEQPHVGGVPDPELPAGGAASHIGGFLYGELHVDYPESFSAPIQVVLSEDGRLRALQLWPYSFPQTHILLAGEFAIDELSIHGNGRAFASDGMTWVDQSTVTDLEFAGTLERPTYTSDGRLLLTWTTAAGDSGRLDAAFAQLSGYYGPLETEGLPGEWLAEQGANGSWYPDPYRSDPSLYPPPGNAEWTVVPGVAIEGQDSDGCIVAGQFRTIDERFSLWDVTYTLRGCDRAGEYSGLALGDNGWYAVRSFVLTADDGTRSQALEFTRH